MMPFAIDAITHLDSSNNLTAVNKRSWETLMLKGSIFIQEERKVNSFSRNLLSCRASRIT
jgi:hypothetical protein